MVSVIFPAIIISLNILAAKIELNSPEEGSSFGIRRKIVFFATAENHCQ